MGFLEHTHTSQFWHEGGGGGGHQLLQTFLVLLVEGKVSAFLVLEGEMFFLLAGEGKSRWSFELLVECEAGAGE